jgi:ATP-dependent DNA helicase DinG
VPVARLSARTDEGTWGIVVDRCDQVIEGRLDRKGIIHSISFERAKWLKEHAQYGELMLLNDRKNTRDVVRQFKEMDPPVVLVTPSVHTGYDFPFDAARYQIIPKMPFMDTRYGISCARSVADPEYGAFHALKTMEQMYGRIVRDEQDFGETFIFDDNVRIMFKFKSFVSKYVLDAYRRVDAVPPAPALR